MSSGYVFIQFVSSLHFGAQMWTLASMIATRVTSLEKQYENYYCKLIIFTQSFLINSSSYLIGAMGLERLYAIFRPISYRSRITVRTNSKISVICILISFCIAVSGIPLYGTDVGYCFGVQRGINMTVVKVRLAFVGFFTYFLPIVGVPLMNAVLIVKLRKRQNASSRFVFQ